MAVLRVIGRYATILNWPPFACGGNRLTAMSDETACVASRDRMYDLGDASFKILHGAAT
jgi:hypothetical protein